MLSKRALWVAMGIAGAIPFTGAVAFVFLGDGLRLNTTAAATFVGSETCAGCRQAEAQLWQSSHHKLAMDHATDKSVLGNFSDATFEYYGVQSRFFRKDGKFFIETDGPDGKLAVFEIKYTFGVDALQQYLVEFPDGRLQALPIAWDSRPKERGGSALVSSVSE